jgi:hypothetical protein
VCANINRLVVDHLLSKRIVTDTGTGTSRRRWRTPRTGETNSGCCKFDIVFPELPPRVVAIMLIIRLGLRYLRLGANDCEKSRREAVVGSKQVDNW